MSKNAENPIKLDRWVHPTAGQLKRWELVTQQIANSESPLFQLVLPIKKIGAYKIELQFPWMCQVVLASLSLLCDQHEVYMYIRPEPTQVLTVVIYLGCFLIEP